MDGSAGQSCTGSCSTVHCLTVQCSAGQCSEGQCSKVQCSLGKVRKGPCSAGQCTVICTVHFSVIKYREELSLIGENRKSIVFQLCVITSVQCSAVLCMLV